MKNTNTIKVNFKGGIIDPARLYNILMACGKSGLLYVRFGLRQQLLFDVILENVSTITAELEALGVGYEVNEMEHPNIMSSLPAEQIFIQDTWLKEEQYLSILDSFQYSPRLKVNISDASQSLTPLLTGNINWISATEVPGYFYLSVRFPKTNTIYEWDQLVPGNEIAALSLKLEDTILQHRSKFYDEGTANGEELMALAKIVESFHTKPAPGPLVLPPFNLPYYEGLTRYGQDLSWLGIYRRDELYSIKFLKELCLLCIETKSGPLCSTPWKTIIIKGIKENHREVWNALLDKYHVNVRHAANELNFQLDDNSLEALKLKQHLVKHLNDDDIRTFGVCIGIKTRKKSEVFSSILVRRRPLIRIGKWGFFHVYDILCAKDYNPNERTDFVFSKDNPKAVLAEQLRRAVGSYYQRNDPKEPEYEMVEERF